MWIFDALFGTSNKEIRGAQVRPYHNDEMSLTNLTRYLDDDRRWTKSRNPPDLYDMIDWTIGEDGKVYAPVFLGGVTALRDPRLMRNIGAVVSIIDPDRFPRSMLGNYISEKQGHLYLPLDDDPLENIGKYLDRSYNFISKHNDKGIPVFIHCAAGMSRSATVAAYYLMRKYGISAIDALTILKTRRPIIRPNNGFLQVLLKKER